MKPLLLLATLFFADAALNFTLTPRAGPGFAFLAADFNQTLLATLTFFAQPTFGPVASDSSFDVYVGAGNNIIKVSETSPGVYGTTVIPIQCNAIGIAYHPNENKMFVNCDNFGPLQRYSFPGMALEASCCGGTNRGTGIVIDTVVNADGKRNVIFARDTTLFTVSPDLTNLTTFAAPVSSGTYDGITIHPTGQYVFVSDYSNNCIRIFNRNGANINTIPVPGTPDGIALSTGSEMFLVSNNNDNRMWRYTFAGNDFAGAATASDFATGGQRGDMMASGPDGCMYVTQNEQLFRICGATSFTGGSSCAEGRTGPDCNSIIVQPPNMDAQCGFIHYTLITLDPPVFLAGRSGFVIPNYLRLSVQASRRYYQVFVNMSNAQRDFYHLCGGKFAMMPNPDDPTNCTYLLQADIAWSDASKCGIYLSENTDSFAYFRGSIVLDELEWIPSVRDRNLTRSLRRVMPFVVRFPKQVSASHTITVYYHPLTPGQNGLQAAIIKQLTSRTADAVAAARSNVTMYTSLEYPFLLSNPGFSYASRNDFITETPYESPTYSFPGESCADVNNAVCEQEWAIGLFTPSSPPVCDFTGDWNMTFTVLCHQSLVTANTCPLPLVGGTPQLSATIGFHLTTEHFCPTVFADVGLSATLTSFQDAAHTITKDNFLSGATAYFIAQAASTDATIVEVSLHSVSSALAGFGATTLYRRPPGGSQHSIIQIQEFPRVVGGVSEHPTQSWFSIVLDTSVFPVNVDSSAGFTISVTLNVVFANTGQGGFHTRQFNVLFSKILAQDNTNNSPVDAHAQVQLAPPADLGSASSVSASILVFSALALLYAF
jgi:hypothetical protein